MPGKRRRTRPTMQKLFRLDQSLCDEVEILLYDPALRRAKYGAWQKLVTELLTLWLEGKRTGRRLTLEPLENDNESA